MMPSTFLLRTVRLASGISLLLSCAACSGGRPNGETCIKNVDCDSAYCRSGVCVAAPSNGADAADAEKTDLENAPPG